MKAEFVKECKKVLNGNIYGQIACEKMKKTLQEMCDYAEAHPLASADAACQDLFDCKAQGYFKV